MRILLAHNNFSVQGGAEVFFHEVGRVLEANGHEVQYFATAEDGLNVPNATGFPTAADYKSGSLLRRSTQLPKMIYNKEAKQAFSSAISSFRPDLIHVFAIYVHLTPAILDAAREASVPVVMSCNDYKHICPNYKLFHHGQICEKCKGGRFHYALVNRCCHDDIAISTASMVEAYVHDHLNIWRKNISMFLFASRFMARKTQEFWGQDVPIDFLKNPFNAEKYQVTPNVGTYMLFFGRLIGEKGVDGLLDAAEQTPEIPIVVVGDGPDRAKLEKRAQKLDNVRIVGPAWGADLERWLYGARAVVVPSIWHENFPYVIMQAFAASTPVIGSRRGGIPELVEEGPHGWIFDPDDSTELATVMRKVYHMSDQEIASIGKRALDWTTDSFSDYAIYSRLNHIYQKVLA